jgi:uncharacterized protein (TIGR02117 family)
MQRLKWKINWKKPKSFIRRLSLGMLVVMILGMVIPTKWSYSQQTDCDFPIYVSSVNNFHAEIIVPVKNDAYDWRQSIDLKPLGPDAGKYQSLSFGWGDQKFFMDNTINPITIFDALLLPGPSVMHVWGHFQLKPTLSQAVQLRQLNLSRSEYLKLAQFIQDSFQLDSQQRPTFLQQGLYANSGFYTAKGTYSGLRTCNAWTAEGLRLADVNTPVWAAIAPVLMAHLKCDCAN